MYHSIKEVLPTTTLDQSLVAVVGSSSGEIRLHRILELLGPKLGKEPYHSPDFELISPVGEDARSELVASMLSLPGEEGHTLFKSSANLRQISDDAATHKALETMYIGPRPEVDEDRFLWSRLFIENIHNSMAIRNRLRIVEKEFSGYVEGAVKIGKDTIHVLSIAAGSSRGIMEALASLNGTGHNLSRLRMVDRSRQALDDGRKLVEELGIQEDVDFIQAHYLSFKRYLEGGYQPDFIEIVGLLDYLPADRVENLFTVLSERLADDGVILYSNIAPNDEQEFTHRIVGWPNMNYRSAEELEGFAKKAGFSKGKLVREPLGIYNIVVARK